MISREVSQDAAETQPRGRVNGRRLVAVLLGACCVLASHAAVFGQQIAVRAVSVTNGLPVSGLRVVVSLADQETLARDGPPRVVELKTNDQGQAITTLPEPLPQEVFVRVEVPERKWICGCFGSGSVGRLLKEGFVSPRPGGTSRKAGGVTMARPGEMIFLMRPPTFWERVFYPILKG